MKTFDRISRCTLAGLLAVFVCVNPLVMPAFAEAAPTEAVATDGITLSAGTFMELRDAFKYDINAQSNQTFVINLTDDIVLEAPATKYRDEDAHKIVYTMDTHGKRYTQVSDMFTVKNGNTVTILGNGHSLIYNDNSTNNTGLGAAGSTLILGSADGSDTLTITFQGTDHQTAPLLGVTDNGAATINSGVTLSNNVNATLFPGGAVSIQTGGVLTMNGGVIEGSTNPTFPMGGAVSIDGGAFHMNGGVIKGNSEPDTINDISGMGGGVSVGSFSNSNPSTFTMGGDATIEGNTAKLGGGVYVGKSGTFTMSGNASIKKNTASQYGGGVYVEKGGTFAMGEDNAVVGNSAQDGGGVLNFGTATLSNVFDNDASNSGADIYNDGTITMEDVKDTWVLSKDQSTSDPNYVSGSKGNAPVDEGGTEGAPIKFQSFFAMPLVDTASAQVANASNKNIDGWYYDGHRETGDTDENGNPVVEHNRWNANEDTADVPQYLQRYAVTGQPTTETMGLKAAHGAQQVAKPDPDTINVIWEDADGAVLYEMDDVDKGHVPAADEYNELSGHKDPTKAADAEDTYQFDGWSRSVDPDGNIIYTADYDATPRAAAASHVLTINYVYDNGSQAAASYTATLEDGDQYQVTSPTIEGYTPDYAVISGTMGDSSRTYTVTYTADPAATPGTTDGTTPGTDDTTPNATDTPDTVDPSTPSTTDTPTATDAHDTGTNNTATGTTGTHTGSTTPSHSNSTGGYHGASSVPQTGDDASTFALVAGAAALAAAAGLGLAGRKLHIARSQER